MIGGGESYRFDVGVIEGDTYLEDIDELGVADVAVLVGVEVVEHHSQFLSGEEHSQFGQKLLEFQFAQNSVLIFVKAL